MPRKWAIDGYRFWRRVGIWVSANALYWLHKKNHFIFLKVLLHMQIRYNNTYLTGLL